MGGYAGDFAGRYWVAGQLQRRGGWQLERRGSDERGGVLFRAGFWLLVRGSCRRGGAFRVVLFGGCFSAVRGEILRGTYRDADPGRGEESGGAFFVMVFEGYFSRLEVA